jgi:hypothetical protein
LHPDKSGAGSEPFLELQNAYMVLSDPVRRAAYDREADSVPVEQVEAGRRPSAEPFREPQPADDLREIWLTRFAPEFEQSFAGLWYTFDFAALPKAETRERLAIDVPLSESEARAEGFQFVCVVIDVAGAEGSPDAGAGGVRGPAALRLSILWTSRTQLDWAGSMSCDCAWMTWGFGVCALPSGLFGMG